MNRRLFIVIAMLASTLVGHAQLPRASDLPDWSGAWTRATGGFFEATPEQALQPAPPPDSPRRRPPYTPAFTKIYEDNLKRIAADRFPDPISICGTPAGWPRSEPVPAR